jgi:hypothetical protein
MATQSPTSTIVGTQPSTFTQDVEKDALPAASKTSEYADAEKNYNPKSIKFWLIIISVYLSFFLVALDRMIIGE